MVACGTIAFVSRLILALMISVGLCAPGVASAQVWKLKKAKTTSTGKAPAKKTKAKSSARPSIKKKKKRSATKPRKVDLVPDEAEVDADSSESSGDRRIDEEPDEPIIVQVEEID